MRVAESEGDLDDAGQAELHEVEDDVVGEVEVVAAALVAHMRQVPAIRLLWCLDGSLNVVGTKVKHILQNLMQHEERTSKCSHRPQNNDYRVEQESPEM